MKLRFSIRDLATKLLGRRAPKMIEVDDALVERLRKVSGGLSTESCRNFLAGVSATNRVAAVAGLEKAKQRRDDLPPSR
jgi:hypothetical protein